MSSGRNIALIVSLEEYYLYQRVRSEWVNQGDLNTCFFHLSTLKRRRMNKSISLQKFDDSWIFDDNELQDLIFQFFKDIYLAYEVYHPL
jgi:hypothetical protein